MSFRALDGLNHMHNLKDDLESFIYVVLYAALRWLQVESSFTLNWWITRFFSVPGTIGAGSCADMKRANAQTRKYSSDLESAKSPQVVNWLKAAMDLHYDCEHETHNPLWDSGVALREMWTRTLAEDLPADDRRVNPVPYIKIREDYSLHVTYTVATSFIDLCRYQKESSQPIVSAAQPLVPTLTKRPCTHSASNNVLHPTPQAPKRPRTGKKPQTLSVLMEDGGQI